VAFEKTGPIDLGVFVPRDGRFVLRVEAVESVTPDDDRRLFAGLDCIVLETP